MNINITVIIIIIIASLSIFSDLSAASLVFVLALPGIRYDKK